MGTTASFMNRACTVNLRQACGRGGECSTSVWNTAYWDEEEDFFVFDWREQKTLKEDPMAMGCDLFNYEICFMHANATYMVCCPGMFSNLDQNIQWMFPTLQNMADGGVARRVTRSIQDLEGIVPGVSKEMSSGSIRVGSVDDMAFNPTCDAMNIIYRGNWSVKEEPRMLVYATRFAHASKGGKCLSGAENCNLVIYAPSLKVITNDENEHLLSNLGKHFFNTSDENYFNQPEILLGRHAFMATLIMWHNQYVLDHGKENLLVLTMLGHCASCGIPEQTLVRWSTAIFNEWQLKNALHYPETSTKFEHSRKMSLMQKQLVVQQIEIKNMEQNQRVMTNKFSVLEAQNLEMLRLMRSMTAGCAIPKKNGLHIVKTEFISIFDICLLILIH